MLRTNRLIAPVGLALVSLSLAAVPFLFNVTGADLRFGSRLTSVTAVWNQVANVFIAVYQPSSVGRLLALDYGTEDSVDSPAEKCSGPAAVVACLDSTTTDPSETDAWIGCSAARASIEVSVTQASPDTKSQRAKCARVAQVVQVKPCRAALAINVAARSVPVPPINLPRIDLLKVIEAALKAEMATRVTDSHFADYRIQPRLELTRLVNRSSSSSYQYTVKRGGSGCEAECERAPRPDPGTREKIRKAFAPSFGSQS